MSWTSAVQVGGAASSGQVANLTATFGSGVTSGNIIIVICNGFSSSPTGITFSCTDNQSNTYVLASTKTQVDSTTYETWAVFYLIVPLGSNGVVLAPKITASPSTYCNMGIAEFSISSTPILDSGLVSTSGNAQATISTPSILVTGVDLIIAGAETNSTTGHDVSVGTDFTQIFQNNYNPGVSLGACFEYKINLIINTIATFSFNGSGADRWNLAGCSFRLPTNNSSSLITQELIETLYSAQGQSLTTQQIIETLYSAQGYQSDSTQIIIETLMKVFTGSLILVPMNGLNRNSRMTGGMN